MSTEIDFWIGKAKEMEVEIADLRRQLENMKTPKEPKKCLPKTPSKSAATWTAYHDAFLSRYGVEPLRNATVNGQLAHFVSRVPAEEAPQIAKFYVSHSDYYYVKKMHPVGLLLQDAEKLRAEWISGRKMTHNQAKSAESVDFYAEQMRRLDETD